MSQDETLDADVVKETADANKTIVDEIKSSTKAKKKHIEKKYQVSKDGRIFFKNDETYLPVTFQQFEDLTNEILSAVNMVCHPHALSADYMAQVLTSAIHSLKADEGLVKKSSLFKACIKRISSHITFEASQEIQERLKAEAKKNGEELGSVPMEPGAEDAAVIPKESAVGNDLPPGSTPQ